MGQLLKPAENEMAFAKVGFLGFNKSGKTFTATEMAIGLMKMIKSKKPLAFLDTETGSDYMIPKVKKAGFDMIVAKTRAFKDLLEITAEAQKNSDVLIVDSVSHIWTDLIESYLARKKKNQLAFQDWGVIKPTWRQFTDLYVTSPIHIIICARAQWDWDYFENEDTGKMELYKAGTKMRAETEFGFEPSLLIEMERIKEGKKLTHRAWVLGDRSQLLDGKQFDNPSFKDFEPHFKFLAIGGKHHAVDTARTSEEMFEPDTGRPEWKEKQIKRQIAIDEIQNYLQEVWPSTSVKDKTARLDCMEALFGKRSWEHVTNKVDLGTLENAAATLKVFRVRFPEIIQDDSFKDLPDKDQIFRALPMVKTERQAAQGDIPF